MPGIGEVLRSVRGAAGLTQEQLAERAGLSARTVSDIERGLRRRLYVDTAERLAAALELSAEDRSDFLDRARGRPGGPTDLEPGFRRRFVSWHVDLVERAGQEVGNEERWYAAIDAEEPNFTTALRWADAAGDTESLLRLATGLWQYWHARGMFAQGRSWLQTGLDRADGPDPALLARAWWGLAWLCYQQGDDLGAASAAARLSDLAASDPVVRRNAATVTGMVALAADRSDDARRDLTDALELARTLDQPWLLGASLLNLGIATIGDSSSDDAVVLLEDAASTFRRIGDERFHARCLGYLGLAALVDRDVDRARNRLVDSLRAFAALSDPSGTAEGLTGLAAVAALAGAPERAAELAGAAERLRESTGGRILPVERRIVDRHLDAARHTVASSAWETAWTAGRARRLDDAIAAALTT